MLTFVGKYTTAYVMIDSIDMETEKQIKEMINHEAFTLPVAIMPDTHASPGKGAVIGFTMYLPNKVIPNVIGVDKGCFVGLTKVSLLNGMQYSFLELLNMGEFYVYSMDEKSHIVPGKARCVKTKDNSDLIEVGISGGEIIKCTPDQLFMLIDGSYKKAEDLIPKQDSLMPLYRTYDTRDGYESIHSYKSKAIHTHDMVSEYFLGTRPDNFCAHHKDTLWFNNSPENLEYIDKKIHSSITAKSRDYFKSKEFKQKRKETFTEKGRTFDPKYLKKKQDTIKENFKKYIKTNRIDWLSKVKENGKRGYKYLEKLSGVYKCNECEKTCFNKGSFNRHLKTHIQKNNHKVLFVKRVDSKEDVYCLQVEKYHNFAISAGVIVHNCGMLSYDIGQGNLIDLSPGRIDELVRGIVPFGKEVNNSFDEKPIEILCKTVQELLKLFVKQFNKRYNTLYTVPEMTSEIIKKKAEKFEVNYNRVVMSLGSLGGGNHFIEVGVSELTGDNWITVHSGSRQFGLKSATYHQKKAGKDPLDYLEGNEMFDYLVDLLLCQTYAQMNRSIMMERIINSLGVSKKVNRIVESVHNYVDFNDFIIRKGAISSYNLVPMVIPFNMEDGILICKGKNNIDWNCSAPHGAGRLGSRKWAKATLSAEEAKDRMDKKGIYCSRMPKDELKGAYKDPKEIEAAISPTAEITDRIRPLVVCKE